MKSVLEILELSAGYLKKKAISNPRRQAEELVGDVLGMKRLDLYMHFDRPLTEKELTLCRERLHRRGEGEPIAYLQGEVEFFGCFFKVNQNVLIPRQETEILVDNVAKYLEKLDLKEKVLFDLCTGSGCIGISLKKRFPDLHVILNDLSKDALLIAKENAKKNSVEVEFVEGNCFSVLEGKKAHFLISNPPYVSEDEWENLEKEVKDFEPKMALVPGKSGMEFYQMLQGKLPHFLFPKGMMWLEIGASQGDKILSLWSEGKVGKDYAGNDRFFSLEFE